jgi:hypothetical protein
MLKMLEILEMLEVLECIETALQFRLLYAFNFAISNFPRSCSIY